MTIDAPPLVVPLDRNSPLREWMNDPVGRRLLERELADRIASAWRQHTSVS